MAKQKEIIAGFQRGLEQQEFVVHYQPKVMADDKTIYGGEALVRWNRHGTLIYPGDFIPVLERDGSICKLDFYVLENGFDLSDYDTRTLSFAKEYSDKLLAIDVNLNTTEMLDVTWGLFAKYFQPEEVNIRQEFIDAHWVK